MHDYDLIITLTGVDLALVTPNPNHPLAPAALDAWVSAEPHAFVESVASMSIVALLVMAVAWRCGWRPSRWWAADTVFP